MLCNCMKGYYTGNRHAGNRKKACTTYNLLNLAPSQMGVPTPTKGRLIAALEGLEIMQTFFSKGKKGQARWVDFQLSKVKTVDQLFNLLRPFPERTGKNVNTLAKYPPGAPIKDGRGRILGSSAKTEKSLLLGVATAVMYLAPAKMSGINTCPMAGACAAVCLGKTSGNMKYKANQIVMIRKTLYYYLFESVFLQQLEAEIRHWDALASHRGLRSSFRLNGTSDILWERKKFPDGRNIMERNSDLKFYDYTKFARKHRGAKGTGKLPTNYTLTFSYSEQTWTHKEAFTWLKAGGRVAVVIRHAVPFPLNKPNPKGYKYYRGQSHIALQLTEQAKQAVLTKGSLWGYPVIDGDISDDRASDPPGVWVLLGAKGTGAWDETGFTLAIHEDGTPDMPHPLGLGSRMMGRLTRRRRRR